MHTTCIDKPAGRPAIPQPFRRIIGQGTLRRIGTFLCLTVLCICCIYPGVASAQSADSLYPTPERLFHIARSLNRNLVCYDANLQSGKLDTEEPINVYWLNRTDRPGHTNGLSFIQKKLAYGYKVVSREGDQCRVTLSAYPARAITIRRDGQRYAGFIPINGSEARLTSLYVQLKPNSSINVDYVELIGISTATGEEVREKIRN